MVLVDFYYSWFYHNLLLVVTGHCSKTSADFIKYIQTLWVSERMKTMEMSPQETESFSIF